MLLLQPAADGDCDSLPSLSFRQLALPMVTLRAFPWLRHALAPVTAGALENPLFRPDAVGGWGAKTSARYARLHANLRKLPFVTLEDGFYRSVGLGKAGTPAVSLTFDRNGPYFDARQPSELEQMLLLGPDAAVETRGARLRQFIVEHRLSKYNHVFDAPVQLGAMTRLPRILLIDQVAHDRSLAGAGADAATFLAMRSQAEACARQGRAQIFMKTHPDVAAGYATGMLGGASALVSSVADVAPHALLDEIDEVWTASSQFGFDALLRGKRVVVFAAPFYAGWGLTIDQVSAAAPHARVALDRRSGHNLSIDALAGTVIGSYPIYYDPVRKQPVQAEAALERLASWRDRHFQRPGKAHSGRGLIAVGFARHKQKLLRAHLGASGADVHFVRREPADLCAQVAQRQIGEVLAWGDRLSLPAEAAIRDSGVIVTRVEDGFLRSRGLGHKNTPPVSWCFDERAACFDASRPSDLEHLLQTRAFSDAERTRGAALRRRIVDGGFTKYNLREPAPDLRSSAGARQIVLVMAQVPGDASWRLGSVPFESNLQFLAAVRAQCPDAFVVFKEHPDLATGLRPGATDLQAAARLADFTMTSGDAASLYPQVDALHVMTSLSGFEAVLRSKSVTCWGMPFYAGWGLTTDQQPCERRSRRLTVDELIVGALCLYPASLDPATGIPCEAEDVLDILA